ncbi:hypothetical protein ANCCAN_21118 [Ancylostoma caninum]|uniref:Uncharacterized protein n=1 Tax=Ancylostoma caninum TaxID=29170 RepID=A0A368FLN6_ANCCA|nr:hypothetical protein ANCCAN_21118 [Ancylostoma caninum]
MPRLVFMCVPSFQCFHSEGYHFHDTDAADTDVRQYTIAGRKLRPKSRSESCRPLGGRSGQQQ